MVNKEMRRTAKRALKNTRQILAHMEGYLDSGNPKSCELACAFLQVLGYHLEFGDLIPENVHLALLLRSKNESREVN
jgi:hypothetical protein